MSERERESKPAPEKTFCLAHAGGKRCIEAAVLPVCCDPTNVLLASCIRLDDNSVQGAHGQLQMHRGRGSRRHCSSLTALVLLLLHLEAHSHVSSILLWVCCICSKEPCFVRPCPGPCSYFRFLMPCPFSEVHSPFLSHPFDRERKSKRGFQRDYE